MFIPKFHSFMDFPLMVYIEIFLTFLLWFAFMFSNLSSLVLDVSFKYSIHLNLGFPFMDFHKWNLVFQLWSLTIELQIPYSIYYLDLCSKQSLVQGLTYPLLSWSYRLRVRKVSMWMWLTQSTYAFQNIQQGSL